MVSKDASVLIADCRSPTVGRWYKCVQTFCNPGDGVLVSEWTYPSAIASMAPYNVKPVAVPMDGQGMSSAGLRKVLSEWDESATGMPR